MITAKRNPKRPLSQTQVLAGLVAAASAVVGLALANSSPLLALGVLVLAGMAFVLLSRPEWVTLIVIFALYSNLTVIAIRQGVPPQIAGGILLALGYPLFHYLIGHRERIIITAPFVLMVIYLATLLLSAAFSDQPTLTFERIQNFVLEGLILYFLVINAVRNRAILRLTIWVLLLAGSLMGALTIFQGVTQSYDNDFGGLAQATDAEVPVSEEDFVGNTIVVKRLAGPIGEKNRYAQVLVVLIPLAITRMLAERRKSLRFAAFVAMMLILGGIQFTFSRGAGVAIGVILLALLPMRLAKARHFMIVGTLIVIAVFALAPGYFYRLSTLGDVADLVSGDPTEAGSSVQGRATENLATLLMFLDHPVVGVGPGQAPRLMRDYGRGIGFRLLDPNRRAHNMYLEELADTGILGFSAFIAIVLVTTFTLDTIRRRARAGDPDTFYLASGFLLSLIAYLTTAIFLHLAYARYYWFLLAIAGAAAHILKQGTSKARV